MGTRQFELNGASRINGEGMDPRRVDQVVAVDTTEIWEVTNSSGNPHNFHPHDVRFRVVDDDGEPPPARLAGPKDTVFIPPGATVRIVVRFSDYTDPTTPYMFHCHVLLHEDNGMMGAAHRRPPRRRRRGTPAYRRPHRPRLTARRTVVPP